MHNRYPYIYIDADTNTHTYTHHIHANIYTYTLYTYIHIQWNGLLMHLCGGDVIHRHTLHYRTLRTDIFLSKNAPTDPHPHQTTIQVAVTAPSKKTPSYFRAHHSFLLTYKLLVQRIFQIVQYHLWFRLLEIFAVRYIDEPTYSHSTQLYFLDYR